MAHIQYVDSLVREYMLFRGFAGTLKAFDGEQRTDKDKGFRVDKIIEHITHAIQVHDLAGVRDIWAHLDGHLFSKLEHTFAAAVNKLESGILKLYLVTAFGASKSDKITEFFTKLAPELHAQSEWKDWFFFPFCKNPEENAAFAVCFSKQWQDTLLISLHNFLATIFQCMPQPTLVRAHNEASLVRNLQDENGALRSRLHALLQQQQQQQQHQSGESPQSTGSAVTHQSRLSSFHKQSRTATTAGHLLDPAQRRAASNPPQSLNDLAPLDIPPPTEIVDDFYIIAMESMQHAQTVEGQTRGLRSLIKNIGSASAASGTSPVLGRKESLDRGTGKTRSGSSGSGRTSAWTLH